MVLLTSLPFKGMKMLKDLRIPKSALDGVHDEKLLQFLSSDITNDPAIFYPELYDLFKEEEVSSFEAWTAGCIVLTSAGYLHLNVDHSVAVYARLSIFHRERTRKSMRLFIFFMWCVQSSYYVNLECNSCTRFFHLNRSTTVWRWVHHLYKSKSLSVTTTYTACSLCLVSAVNVYKI